MLRHLYPLGKAPPHTGGPQPEGGNLFPALRAEPRLVGLRARSLVTVLTELPQLYGRYNDYCDDIS